MGGRSIGCSCLTSKSGRGSRKWQEVGAVRWQGVGQSLNPSHRAMTTALGALPSEAPRSSPNANVCFGWSMRCKTSLPINVSAHPTLSGWFGVALHSGIINSFVFYFFGNLGKTVNWVSICNCLWTTWTSRVKLPLFYSLSGLMMSRSAAPASLVDKPNISLAEDVIIRRCSRMIRISLSNAGYWQMHALPLTQFSANGW